MKIKIKDKVVLSSDRRAIVYEVIDKKDFSIQIRQKEGYKPFWIDICYIHKVIKEK